MHQQTLRRFFEGQASAAELQADLAGTRLAPETVGFRTSANYRVIEMSEEFAVRPEHLVRLVVAVEAGTLSLEELGQLAFILEFSTDQFRWTTDEPEGERVADALFWLGTPEINYPLTPATLAKIRHYLLTGVNTLDELGTGSGEPGA